MQQSGQVVWYSTSTDRHPLDLLRKVLVLDQTTEIPRAVRSMGEDKSWVRFLSGREQEYEVFRDVSIHDLNKLYIPNTSLEVSLVGRVLKEMDRSLRDRIPDNIRNGFVPCGPRVTLGAHDIFDSTEHEQGKLFARAVFSFRLWGWGSPHDWHAYRDIVWRLPEVEVLQVEIEAIVGSVETCVYWAGA